MRVQDRRVVFGTKLSDNIIVDTNGQLIAKNVLIARTGEQDYLGLEISDDLEPEKKYVIERLPQHVFDPKFMASFENKPFVDLHPDTDVTVDNYKQLSKGFIRDIRKGKFEMRGLDKKYYDAEGNNALYADVVITDRDMIGLIQGELEKPTDNREIDVSCGYDAMYYPIDNDRIMQVGIMGNHLARVPAGRAGVAKIRDHEFLERREEPMDVAINDENIRLKKATDGAYTLVDNGKIKGTITAKEVEEKKLNTLLKIQDHLLTQAKDEESEESEDAVVTKSHKGFKIQSDDLETFMITKGGKFIKTVKADSFEEVKAKIDKGEIKAKDYKVKFKDAVLIMQDYPSKSQAKLDAMLIYKAMDGGKEDKILNEAIRKINWNSLGFGEGMKAKQRLSNRWIHWTKEIEANGWNAAQVQKELEKTFNIK